MKKRDLENRNIDLKEKRMQVSDNNNMEATALMNIANSYKTPQSFQEYVTKMSTEKTDCG